MKIRLLLVEDLRVMRNGLRALLDKQECFEVAGTADNWRMAVNMTMDLNAHTRWM